MSYRRSALVSTAGSPTTLSVSRMQLKPEVESAESGGVNETTIQLRTMETSQEEADEKTTMDTSLSSTTTPSEPTLLELFPWISDFQRFCRSALQEQSMASLIHLMEFYTRNVNESVDKCLTKRLHAARLKEFMSESLPLFLFYYRGIHEGRQRERYLDAMSDILALYVDLELKASRSKEHAEVCSRITTCLYVYLEDSTEHLLETLMKVQLKIQLNRNYHHILDPLIMKLFQGLSNFAPKDGAMYVRYLLVCRLWEKMNSGITDKKRINTLTLTLLALDDTLILQEFPTKCALPQIPKSEESNPIKFLLLENFDVRDSCRKFLKLAHPPTESSTAWV